MAISTKEVLAHLKSEEPDYDAAAAMAPPAMVPDLITMLKGIAGGSDIHLAAGAPYLAARLGTPDATEVIEVAARHPDPIVRVAAAAALRDLPRDEAPDLLTFDALLRDPDAGVRKFAVKSAGAWRLEDRLREVARSDPKAFIRDLAREQLGPA